MKTILQFAFVMLMLAAVLCLGCFTEQAGAQWYSAGGVDYYRSGGSAGGYGAAGGSAGGYGGMYQGGSAGGYPQAYAQPAYGYQQPYAQPAYYGRPGLFGRRMMQQPMYGSPWGGGGYGGGNGGIGFGIGFNAGIGW